ncbi:MAG: 2-dehydropantoate 2-reductase [Elusimicrobia bacterium]|nr:2-dehydropantoate 2-reductase [Elusimicrobiota bacterium]
MKIVIIGAGAMGTLFAGFLAKRLNSVTLVVKNNRVKKLIERNGIKITGLSKVSVPPSELKVTSDYSPLRSLSSSSTRQSGRLSEASKTCSPDLAIIFTKAYDTSKAVKILGRNTFVLTLQNGIGNYENIAKFVDKNRIVCGTTSESAVFLKYGKVIHTGKGETIIAKTKSDISGKIVSIFNKYGINTSINKEIESVIWSKLVLNCAVNPVAAISGVKNGDIIRHNNLKEVAIEAGKEAVKVAEAVGIRLLFSDVSKKISDICRTTAGNTNSMLADVSSGRKTEIDFMNGAIIKTAKKLKIPVPVNEILYKLVKKLERI